MSTAEKIGPGGGQPISIAQKSQVEPASIFKRFVATLIDGIIMSIATYPVTFGMMFFMGSAMQTGDPNAMIIFNIVSYVFNFGIAFLYYGYFYNKRGATPGKMLFKIKVLNHETGENLTWTMAFVREVIGKFISAIILGIGFFMAIFREDKRALHDMIASSHVIQE